MEVGIRGRQTQFYIDVLYGLAFAVGFGYLIVFGMDARVAAFQGGIVLGYFLRVWENMHIYERILEEEVASQAQERVEEEVETQVPEQIEEKVRNRSPEEIDEELEAQVAEEVQTQVAEEIQAQFSDESGRGRVDDIEAELIDRVEDIDEELAEHIRGYLDEEMPTEDESASN